jgi:hypothetical protein
MKFLLGVLCVLCGSLCPAHGYVRTRSSKTAPGIPSYWPAQCVFVLPDSSTVTTDLSSDQVYSIIQKSVSNWLTASASCSYLQINLDTPAAGEAHYDGINVIKFRQDKWCHPEDAQNHNQCYDPAAAAITSVFMINDGDPKDGLILDADIELNDIDFQFVDIVPGTPLPACTMPNAAVADLENTLTHELGHLQGLSHTCRDAASFANDVDENGNVPPFCSDVLRLPKTDPTYLKITNATMYNNAAPCETKKRNPTSDDVAGICNAYPTAMVRDTLCEHTQLSKYTTRSGCTMGAATPWQTPVFLLVTLALAGNWISRRRRN